MSLRADSPNYLQLYRFPMDFSQSGFTDSRDLENKATVKFLLHSFYLVEFSAAGSDQII